MTTSDECLLVQTFDQKDQQQSFCLNNNNSNEEQHATAVMFHHLSVNTPLPAAEISAAMTRTFTPHHYLHQRYVFTDLINGIFAIIICKTVYGCQSVRNSTFDHSSLIHWALNDQRFMVKVNTYFSHKFRILYLIFICHRLVLHWGWILMLRKYKGNYWMKEVYLSSVFWSWKSHLIAFFASSLTCQTVSDLGSYWNSDSSHKLEVSWLEWDWLRPRKMIVYNLNMDHAHGVIFVYDPHTHLTMSNKKQLVKI